MVLHPELAVDLTTNHGVETAACQSILRSDVHSPVFGFGEPCKPKSVYQKPAGLTWKLPRWKTLVPSAAFWELPC